MPAPDKKGPLTVLLLNWVKWQKNAALSHSAPLISLSFKPYILLYFLPLFIYLFFFPSPYHFPLRREGGLFFSQLLLR